MSRSTTPNRHSGATAGFTLIEVLAALTIIAVLFSSLAALVVTTARGTRSIEGHLTELESSRALLTSLPDRDQLVPGTLRGELARYRWQVDISPFNTREVGPAQTTWAPERITVTLRSPEGRTTHLETVRLHRSANR